MRGVYTEILIKLRSEDIYYRVTFKREMRIGEYIRMCV